MNLSAIRVSFGDRGIREEYAHLLGKRLGDGNACLVLEAGMDLAGISLAVEAALVAMGASSEEGTCILSSVFSVEITRNIFIGAQDIF